MRRPAGSDSRIPVAAPAGGPRDPLGPVLAWCAALSALATAGVVALACGGGGDSPCGNGVVDPGEQCDDGNTDPNDDCDNNCLSNLPTLRVRWVFNRDAADQFDQDGCLDLGVSRVEVDIVHATDPTVAESASETCSLRQVTFLALPRGDYVVTLRPVDSDGALLTRAPIENLVTVREDVEAEFNIPYDQWARDYTGTLYFRLHWGQADVDCAAAVPPVVQQRLTLERDGTAVAQSTEQGTPLDGSAPGPCQSLAEPFPQSALSVPWGPYTLHVEGLDGAGDAQFAGDFDTFVGAGVSNPEMQFVVPSLAPDAGVPDAGPADAPVADAGGPDA
ncbi:MAG: hypothetical protein D6689_14790 [Deltaproteobacteria bacterium]|nr:MAG: hypothetical protein D6689_14790 [Deltaproteobacteria bacterium]